MDKRQAEKIVGLLSEAYPDAKCELNYRSPFELLVAVILSAQCTDKRVNEVTSKLFLKYNTPFDFAALPAETLEKEIYTCGFYHNKAKNIIGASKAIVSDYNGEVPSAMDKLVALPGVGRKTANVVIAVAFGGEALAVDTHVFRISHRLGLSDAPTADKTEEQLTKLLPSDMWYKAHHAMIFHGRYTCHSRNPDCGKCTVKQYCNYIKERVNE